MLPCLCENPFRQSCEVAIWPSPIFYLHHGYNGCGRLVDHPKPQLQKHLEKRPIFDHPKIQELSKTHPAIHFTISPFPCHFPGKSEKKQPKIPKNPGENLKKSPRDVRFFPHWTLRPGLGWSRWTVRWRRPTWPVGRSGAKDLPKKWGKPVGKCGSMWRKTDVFVEYL